MSANEKRVQVGVKRLALALALALTHPLCCCTSFSGLLCLGACQRCWVIAPGLTGEQILKISFAAPVNGDSEARSVLSETPPVMPRSTKGHLLLVFSQHERVDWSRFLCTLYLRTALLISLRVKRSPFRLVPHERSSCYAWSLFSTLSPVFLPLKMLQLPLSIRRAFLSLSQ